MQGLGCVHSTPRGVTLLEDVVRQVADHADNERWQTLRQKRRLWSATRTDAWAQGEETPPSWNPREMTMRRVKTRKRRI
jgi:hypothetical protein